MSDFEFDLRRLAAQINDLQKRVLPKAQAGFLNSIAFNARKNLMEYADEKIEGGPTPFTRRGFVVDRAILTAVDMAAVVKLLPAQSEYMRYRRGVRHAGDPGAGQYDILFEGAETTQQGNVKKGFLRRTARAAKDERIKRTRLRDKREKLSAAGKGASAFEWNVQAKGSPGTFFGEVEGIRGYWQRPDPNNWVMSPTLLSRFSDETTHKPTFDWEGVVEKAADRQDLGSLFASELTRARKDQIGCRLIASCAAGDDDFSQEDIIMLALSNDDITVTTLPTAHPRTWIAIGSEADIKALLKTWSGVFRFHIEEIPEDRNVYWDLTNALQQGLRRDTIRNVGGRIEIDRRRLKELRDGVEWLFDYLSEEHHEARYEWFEHIGDWVRCNDAPQPITELKEAHKAISLIDTIFDISADNVVRLTDRVVAQWNTLAGAASRLR